MGKGSRAPSGSAPDQGEATVLIRQPVAITLWREAHTYKYRTNTQAYEYNSPLPQSCCLLPFLKFQFTYGRLVRLWVLL